jgi:hypothetical protein
MAVCAMVCYAMICYAMLWCHMIILKRVIAKGGGGATIRSKSKAVKAKIHTRGNNMS